MNCCCSRATFAIVIGIIHAIVNLGVAIYCTITLVSLDNMNLEAMDVEPIRIGMSVALAMTLITVVLCVTMIVGVVMKRYMFIVPYLCMGIIGMILYAGVYFLVICFLIYRGAPATAILLVILRVVLVTCVQFLILKPIYSLYKEWRAEALGASKPIQKMYATAPFGYQNIYGTEKKPMPL